MYIHFVPGPRTETPAVIVGTYDEPALGVAAVVVTFAIVVCLIAMASTRWTWRAGPAVGGDRAALMPGQAESEQRGVGEVGVVRPWHFGFAGAKVGHAVQSRPQVEREE